MVLLRAHRRRMEQQVDLEALGAWLTASWSRTKRLHSFTREWRHSRDGGGSTAETAAQQRAALEHYSQRLPKGFVPLSR